MLLKIWLGIFILNLAMLALCEIRIKTNKNIKVAIKQTNDSGDSKIITYIKMLLVSSVPIVNIFILLILLYMFIMSEEDLIKILNKYN